MKNDQNLAAENGDAVSVLDAAELMHSVNQNGLKKVNASPENGSQEDRSAHASQEKMTEDFPFPHEWKFESLHPVSLNGFMYAYCNSAFWGKKSEEQDQLRMIIRTKFPKQCDKELLRADEWLVPALKCYAEVNQGRQSPELQKKINFLGGPLVYRIKKDRQNKEERKKKKEVLKNHTVAIKPAEAKKRSVSLDEFPEQQSRGENISAKYQHHPNDIMGLAPQKEWILMIDESGNSEAGAFRTAEKGDGVIAGVLMPASQKLRVPEFPDLHASTDNTEERITAGDHLIENMSHHPCCGVLAFPISALRSSKDWAEAIGIMIDLVMRLLPVKEKCSLKVYVEHKDIYDVSEHFKYIRDACLFGLMKSFPAKAEKLDLSVKVMDKSFKYDAYPDFVANTCYTRKGGIGGARMQAAKWDKTCFLNFPPEEMGNVLDCCYSGRDIRSEHWDLLLNCSSRGRNFADGLLAVLGEECRMDQKVWKKYLDYTIGHLNSKAIHLSSLQKQIEFLKDYQPEKSQLPPRLRLLWLTAGLAESNHRGSTVVREEEEFRKLITDLYEEDAPLTCWATLHLAVTYTNAFEFKKAEKTVEEYLELVSRATWGSELPSWVHSAFDLLMSSLKIQPCSPVAIPGLCYYAQMISSHGQHEAFLGRNESAVTFFQEAIRLFGKLSDPEQGKKEIGHTTAYLLTSLMDMESPDPQILQDTLLSYYGKPLTEAAKELAGDTDSKKKYHHHLLLRYLSSGKAPEDAVKAYLSAKSTWKTGENGHPWELIEFYRALLVEDESERKQHLERAVELCGGNDATLHVISAVILGGLLLQEQARKDEYLELVRKCMDEVPALGERGTVLLNQPECRLSPLELAKQVLPFNFR